MDAPIGTRRDETKPASEAARGASRPLIIVISSRARGDRTEGALIIIIINKSQSASGFGSGAARFSGRARARVRNCAAL